MSEETETLEDVVENAETKISAKKFIGLMLTLPIVVEILLSIGAWQSNRMGEVYLYGGIAAGLLVMAILCYAKKVIAPFWFAILMLACIAHCFHDLKVNTADTRFSCLFLGGYAVCALPAAVLAWWNYANEKMKRTGVVVKGVWNVPIAFLVLFIAAIAAGYKYLQLAH